MTPEPGLSIADKYRLDRPLAQGGMGAIWVAEHVDLGVDVAVKLMTDDVAKSPLGRKRFRREARAAARLKSPNVTQIHDYGVFEDTPYIVMELLEGEDLGTYLDRKHKLSVARCAEIITPVCHALKLAHDAGIVHRDLKPSNIFLSRSGEQEVVKILDFGIAKQTVSETAIDANTASGVLVGSPRYMSPEQAQGLSVDHRSDIWSLGVVLYEMLTGDLPFDGENIGQLITSICLHKPLTATSHDETLPGDVDVLFSRLFEADPEERLDSAAKVAVAVEEIAKGGPVSFEARPRPKSEPPPRSVRGRDDETVTSHQDVAYAETARIETPADGTSPGLGMDSEERERPAPTRPWWLAVAALAAIGAGAWALQRSPAPPNAATTNAASQPERPPDRPVPSMPATTARPPAAAPPSAPSVSAAPSAPTPPDPVKTYQPPKPFPKARPLPTAKPKVDDKFGIPTE